jgi:Tol biopolymer transport system component
MALLVIIAAGCASKGDPDPTIETPSPIMSGPAGTLSPIDAWVLYRDDQGNLDARDLQNGDLFKQTVDFNEQVIVQAKCGADGKQIAYLIQNFKESFRRLQIAGENARTDFIQVPATVQGFAWSPAGTRIAVGEWDQQGKKATISIIDVASGGITDLATADKLVAGLDWSPDGSQLVYYLQDLAAGTATVQIRNVNGGDPTTPITRTDLQWLDPMWMPDGKSLIVVGLSTTESHLFRVDLANGEVRQLTTDATIYRRLPQLSPDSSVIAFTGSIIAPQVSAVAMALHQFGIFTVKPDGTDERPVTVDPRTNPGANVDTYLNAYLLGWCPRGSWLDDLWKQEEASR